LRFIEVYKDDCANGLGNGHVGGKKIDLLANRVGMVRAASCRPMRPSGKIMEGPDLAKKRQESCTSQGVIDGLRRAGMALATQDFRGDFPSRVVEFQPLQAHSL
jgi:hypothetical protein